MKSSKTAIMKDALKRRAKIMRLRAKGKSYNEIARLMVPPMTPQRVGAIVRDEETNGTPAFDWGRKRAE